MKDEAISLAVARKICPEYEWNSNCGNTHAFTMSTGKFIVFDYTSKEALADMVLWLANNHYKERARIGVMLVHENPNKAVAEAIIEAENERN